MDGRTVIGRASAIIDVVAAGAGPCPLARLAADTGIPKPTVRRIANQLVAERVLRREPQGYRLGLRLIALGSAAGKQLGTAEAAAPHVHDLHEQTRQISWVAAFDGDDLVVLDIAYAQRHATAVVATWQPRMVIGPTAAMAAGQVLLAQRPAQAERLLRAGGLTRLTPRTVTNPGLLQGRLSRVAETGMAYEYEEARLGWWCGAVLVPTPAGPYVLGLTAEVGRLPMARGLRQLQLAAEQLRREPTLRAAR